MGAYERGVFLSYAWGTEREEIVNKLDQSLHQRGIKIIRDKRDLDYRGSIQEFMRRIGQGQCVIVVVSDKYLRSPNCMFELVELAENRQFYDRIFPIILSDANIYDPVKRLEYVRFWEEKRTQLAEAIKTVDPANLQGIREDMDNYDRFRDKISGLTSILKDMNTLTPEMHSDSDFEALFSAIESRLSQNDLTGKAGSAMESSDSNDRNQKGTTSYSQSRQTIHSNHTNVAGEDQNKATQEAVPSTDSPPEASRTEQKGAVNISGVERLTVGGDIVGGNKTEVTYLDRYGLFQGQINNRQDILAELEKLREALAEVVKREKIDQEKAVLASAQVEAAILNARKPDADPDKITQRLNQAKEIIAKTTAGVSAAAGLVTAFNQAIELIHRLFM